MKIQRILIVLSCLMLVISAVCFGLYFAATTASSPTEPLHTPAESTGVPPGGHFWHNTLYHVDGTINRDSVAYRSADGTTY